MLIEEEEPKSTGEISPDALEAVFADESEVLVEGEDVVHYKNPDDEDSDELDIAFYDDEGHW